MVYAYKWQGTASPLGVLLGPAPENLLKTSENHTFAGPVQ